MNTALNQGKTAHIALKCVCTLLIENRKIYTLAVDPERQPTFDGRLTLTNLD